MMILILKYVGIGIAATLFIYVLAKIILQHTIRTSTDFYEKEEIRQEEEMLKNITVVKEEAKG